MRVFWLKVKRLGSAMIAEITISTSLLKAVRQQYRH